MEEAFWAARQGDALLHTSFMADVLGAVLEVAANVVIDALIVGTTSLLAMRCRPRCWRMVSGRC
ncbi:hypothetical protein [Escherichia coli]|uniref:hypothetical protein n=1 Tax=Escherichia coli TaxID=562 RepID=UPI0010096BB8|nr:hypothetical protein [Escherichia coli]QAU70312.1 hypothetical protein ETE50_22535 [Escherichia coli]